MSRQELTVVHLRNQSTEFSLNVRHKLLLKMVCECLREQSNNLKAQHVPTNKPDSSCFILITFFIQGIDSKGYGNQTECVCLNFGITPAQIILTI